MKSSIYQEIGVSTLSSKNGDPRFEKDRVVRSWNTNIMEWGRYRVLSLYALPPVHFIYTAVTY